MSEDTETELKPGQIVRIACDAEVVRSGTTETALLHLGRREISTTYSLGGLRNAEILSPSQPIQEERGGWIRTKNRLPEKPGLASYEYVDCWIFHRGEVKERPWNCEHECWDDLERDDWYASPDDVEFWQPLTRPAPPPNPSRETT